MKLNQFLTEKGKKKYLESISFLMNFCNDLEENDFNLVIDRDTLVDPKTIISALEPLYSAMQVEIGARSYEKD